MAYTTPKTWTVGEVLTAANLNTHLRDNVSYLANPPKCRVYNSANESIPNSTDTALTFDTERFDTDTMHSTVSNTGRITFTTAGTYLVGGHVVFNSSATGIRKLFIRMGGTTPLATVELVPSSSFPAFSIDTLYPFTAGQYVELIAYQTSGGALNVLAGGNHTPEFWAVLVSQ
jgi:hypothetical protein